ncbi:hypothetical protein FIV42_00705 [Persicimonas caeni]|uniref:Uncharacterized protein n=1 Tax=Persicimonas caeni TaxID=2292766 RepID=A0A4Y6PLV1_PERCE|nr:hypothetical protein [Persicimonas caeni]QDG49304.1 hypothetical protein FIV42_00705 [Persicimonas caeni]QED30525.1 hypothetical protein FRD00_00700 [Persicimonas caeni]
MGKTYRKHKGKWVTLEEFEKLTATNADPPSQDREGGPDTPPATDDSEQDTPPDAIELGPPTDDLEQKRLVAEARGVLEREDWREMGSFLAEHREEPTPKGTEDRKQALRDFIEAQ